MKQPLNNIHLWYPNIFGFKGGIQTYSAFLLQALHEIYPFENYDVFLKHDIGLPSDPLSDRIQYHFAGAWPLPLRTAIFASQLLGYALGKQPSLIITSHLNFAIVAYWLKQIAGIRYWVVAHGAEAWNIQSPKLLNAIKHADQVIAVSHCTRNHLLRQGFEACKVAILPNTFDNSRLQISPKPQHLLKRFGLTASQPTILTVSRLDSHEPYKGYDPILRALPAIRAQIPNVHYILVGKGSDRSRIEKLIDHLNLQNSVTLAGFIPDQDLNDYYNLCDVFAMVGKSEGFGIVYLEALACGKPTLGGNQDGAVDALCHGELGALVNPNDIDEISRTLVQILRRTYSHPIMYQPTSLRQRVIDTYGFDCFKGRLSKLVNSYFQDTYL